MTSRLTKALRPMVDYGRIELGTPESGELIAAVKAANETNDELMERAATMRETLREVLMYGDEGIISMRTLKLIRNVLYDENEAEKASALAKVA